MVKHDVERDMARAEWRLETGLTMGGFYVITGSDEGNEWDTAVKLDGLVALNWKRVEPDKWQVLFYYRDMPIPIVVDMGWENLYQLAGELY